MQRALAASLLSQEVSKLYMPCESLDCIHVGEMIVQLGATIKDEGDHLSIHGGFNPQGKELFVGESGLGVRMMTPVAAMSGSALTIQGEGSLLTRPIGVFDNLIPALGGSCSTNDGLMPIQIQGPLTGGEIKMDGSMSSQFLTGMLMALPTASNDSVIEVSNLKSKPYIDLTIEILNEFGIEIQHDNYQKFRIPGGQTYRGTELDIDGDWSGAAFLLVAGAVASRDGIVVDGLQNQFTQADESIKGALMFAGAKLTYQEDGIKILAHKLKGFNFDATDCPDLFPPLAALAAFCNGKSTITGISRLEHKESNRALAIKEEFAKAGINVELVGDNMIVHPSAIQACTMSSRNDHRMAMAATILGLAGKTIEIEGAEAIGKSYPLFYDDIEDLGGRFK
ncbi:MAG: 3-phosphoshikimate 1-carboxyvinyltransferase [Flavobacteriales bacterium]|nr:3-phosphoshikimate 1-carboxyvinyltransferase [Flavobacteriales bacterium]